MFDFQLSRESDITTVHFTGEIQGEDDRDLVNEAFAFIQPDDLLMLDVSGLETLDAAAADLLYELLARRAVVAESVVVSARAEISMQLVLHDIDRVCPIVRAAQDAIAILDRPWAMRR